MPLPQNGAVWPPKDFTQVAAQYDEHNAWYVGDPDLLRAAYQRTRPSVDRPSQYRRGVGGALARFWWGRPIGDLTKRQDGLHIPLAADICQLSADLLFSEPPTLKVDDKKTQERLDDMAGEDLWPTFGSAAELGAALGDSYLRVTWTDDRDHAFLTHVDADGAYPRFRFGQLSEVTFWWVVAQDSTTVWRHFEHHELQGGIGVILHGLYEGTVDKIGRQQPLETHPSTAGLVPLVSTLTPGLAVEHIPNRSEPRRLRKDPVGRNLGRSDLEGVEAELDALDEAYSAWMRDVRLSKSRILVPQYMLESAGRGQGATVDLDQDIYVGMNAAPNGDGTATPWTLIQPDMPIEKHERTTENLIRQILRSTGYSPGSLAEGEAASMRTATEVVAEENRSYRTRDRKIRLWQPRMRRLLTKLLAVDAVVKRQPVKAEPPTIDFADAVQADPESLARTVQALKVAQAASIKTRVKMMHPDWDGTAVDEEVKLIQAEESLAMPPLPPMPTDPDPDPDLEGEDSAEDAAVEPPFGE